MTAAIDRMVDAYNRHDADAFAAEFSEDVVFEDARGAVLLRGRDEVRARFATLFAQFPSLHCRIASRIVVGEYVVDEELVSGRGSDADHVVVVYHLRDGVVDHQRIVR